ncbi:MAG: 50S ribosomal protein L3 [Phycisphaerae bacterium]|nr:50S ribosomal protein L3 [Phycisphaerae bacterium]NIP53700.1 50S ribosomal protein L3 [Phycisphaerae bacterium]NIS52623.1 50S ribosomal protein L3 [Phycisphaerae bacterium]NIU10102.1 50S ribosomal protein L3 [Phycisphaerae bacterium]NIV02696.1 50S ribosomal protein L3 [Phycisphaerae bacterium]
MAMLLGKKVGMTQVYDESGKLLPVTVIQAGPCVVMQVKTAETDGYNAVQLGFEDMKASRRKNPQVGHAQKADTAPKKFVKEMRLPGENETEYKVGDSITVSVFEEDKLVDVVGTSKGKGFAGVMKRHGFGGFPASHGTERKHRAPGSISSFASDAGHGGKPKKGKRMAGHMGNCRVTTKNHRLVSIDEDNNLLVVKGAVPGPSGGYCVVRSAKKV